MGLVTVVGDIEGGIGDFFYVLCSLVSLSSTRSVNSASSQFIYDVTQVIAREPHPPSTRSQSQLSMGKSKSISSSLDLRRGRNNNNQSPGCQNRRVACNCTVLRKYLTESKKNKTESST